MMRWLILSSLAPAIAFRTHDGAHSHMQAAFEKRKGSRDMTLVASNLEKTMRWKREEAKAEFFCNSSLRFSCSIDGIAKTTLPAMNLHYPTTNEMVSAALPSDAVSLRLFDKGQTDGTKWSTTIDSISPRTRPTQPEDAAFWDEFALIANLQYFRRNGTLASEKMKVLPKIFQGYTMEAAAQAVRADFPSDFPTQLVEQFLGEGVDFDEDIIPHVSQDDFVNKQVMLSRIIGWAVATASPICFASKWHEGRPRPEEAAWAVKTRDPRVKDIVPSYVETSVDGLGMTNSFDFTAYAAGSPKHPSWPAMHSAASTASVYLPIVLNLTQAQLDEAVALDCSVATFRSFAGVHYESDNMAGLSIGQEVVIRELPNMLHKEYGSNKKKVEAKIQKMLNGGLFSGHVGHDWRTAASCLK